MKQNNKTNLFEDSLSTPVKDNQVWSTDTNRIRDGIILIVDYYKIDRN